MLPISVQSYRVACGAAFLGRLILVNAALLLIVLIGIEVSFGYWFGRADLMRLNVLRDRSVRMELNDLYEADYKEIVYARDRWGLRSEYRSPEDIDILTLGGSACDQRFISEGYTWHDVIRKAFAEAGKDVSVVNACVDGQTTFGHIKNFDWWFHAIPGLRPKYILAYVGVNDVHLTEQSVWDQVESKQNRLNLLSAEERRRLSTDDLRELRGGLLAQIRDKSVLYHVYRIIRGMRLAAKVQLHNGRRVNFEDMEWTDQPLLPDHRRLTRRSTEEYRQRLRVLLDRIVELGAQPILVTQPAHFYRKQNGVVTGLALKANYHGYNRIEEEINGVDFYNLLHEINTATLEECSKYQGCVAIDLAEELSLDDQDFYDFLHNSPRGTKKIGWYLYGKLRPLFIGQ